MWPELKRQDGEEYCKKTLISIRCGLQRYFIRSRKIDIVGDDTFRESNEIFHCVMVKLKKEGKGVVNHKEPISTDDMNKLQNFLNVDTPDGLQGTVFIDMMMFFCNRGRENLREFRKDDFVLEIGSKGKYFAAVDRLTKNHRNDDEKSSGGCMYEEPQSPRCPPVRAFQNYLDKLNPACEWLWQRPKRIDKVTPDSKPWYDNIPLGKNQLGAMMKTLSAKANLSKTYTNHCFRATCITLLDQKGFQARHIMSVSGHKSEASILRIC